ncbi:MAG: HypC/HybG/HupF family hydrogenase formation chaperone [Nitriliruptoraceae bacterium]
MSYPLLPHGPSVPTPDPGQVCITCSDEGRVAEVVEVVDAHTVRARTPRGLEQVDTTLLATVAVGDRVLVHAGTAIADLPEPDGAR